MTKSELEAALEEALDHADDITAICSGALGLVEAEDIDDDVDVE